jgi:phospholipase D
MMAQSNIYVQAYSLTSYAIINQLITASKRGVKVSAILDNVNFSEGKSVVEELRSAGVEVVRDTASGIAHNKIMIIDEHKVITGSFNFTEAADKRNVENVLLIQDRKVAGEYLANWTRRWEASK